MTTVFQFGEAQFVKDLIFGWCFRSSDQDEWIKLIDFPTNVLLELQSASFPEYVPNDLKKVISDEIERRDVQKTQAINFGKVIQTAWHLHDEAVKKLENDTKRLGDRIQLQSIIISKMISKNNTVSSDLGYLELVKTDNKWQIFVKGTLLDTYLGIDDAIDTILKKWW